MGNPLFTDNDEIEKTLVIGLYHRFKKEKDESENIDYRQEDPYDFESFVAKTLERKYGGKAIATKKSGERGIDIEHRRSEGLFLGQVKCELNNINYVPVAVLHSQMIKQGAVGGYVISVRDFELSAKEHVEGLSIQLINGRELVNIWLHPEPAYKKLFLEELMDAIETKVQELFSQITQNLKTYFKELVSFNSNRSKLK
jgi:restriction system protein